MFEYQNSVIFISALVLNALGKRNCIVDKVLLLWAVMYELKQSGMLPVVMCKAGNGELNPLLTEEFVLLYWFRRLYAVLMFTAELCV